MFTAGLVFLALMLSTSAQAASYQQTDGTIVDPILYTLGFGGGIYPYFGNNLEPFANLFGAGLSHANLTDATLTGATYDEFTLFPSGNTWDMPPWGLDGDIEPWFAGMIPTPEPSLGLMLMIGAGGLAGLASRRG